MDETFDGYERVDMQKQSWLHNCLLTIVGVVIVLAWALVALLVACLNQSNAYHD